MKAPICDGDFLARLIGSSTSHYKRENILVIGDNWRFQHN